MSVRDTSLMAYEAMVATGRDKTQQATVLLTLLRSRKPLTRSEISRRAGLTINATCGRVNELIKERAIQEYERRTCSITGHTAYTVWKI